jgi:hypothetical protein
MSTYERLKAFLTKEMRQSHIYQPVMVKELLEKGGSSKTAEIAQAILSHDPTQVEYYSQVLKNMVGRVLTKNRGITTNDDGACPVNEWTDVPYIPGSPLAEFCVIRKNNQRSQELLERTATELVRATEAIALQELTIHKRQRTRLSRIYTPLIVTTAKIIICDLTLENFDPVTGEIPEGDFETVPFVRFRKTLSATGNIEKMADLGDLAKQSERSVLVVHPASFLEILNKLDVGNIAGLANELWGAQ